MRTLAERIGFTEGPVFTSGGALLVTSMSRGVVYRVSLDGGPATIEAETGGGPNGLAEDGAGLVYVAQNGGATIQSRSARPVSAGLQTLGPDGVVEDLPGACTAPNDLVVGPDGLVWFTDPDLQDAPGAVRTFDPKGGEIRTVADGIAFPNGLAFDAEGDLYVAETRTDAILRHRLEGGRLGPAERFGDAPGGPDGIAFDADGNLYVASFEHDEVQVLGPDGRIVERLSTGQGSRPTNLCFAGSQLETLVVTLAAGGRVVALDGRFRGRRP